uniref:Uncharacterized protein n=1 Tax=Rhizophora mucronata TaxID=61149 RepID=A0A2P2JW78_RHIMU
MCQTRFVIGISSIIRYFELKAQDCAY